MDNKKKIRNILLYIAVPILLILVITMFLSTNQAVKPQTSELVQYFVDDKVDSYTINYGTGVIELTLKEGEKAYDNKKSTQDTAEGSTQPTTEQPTTEQVTTQSATQGNNSPFNLFGGSNNNNKKTKVVVKGELADIQRFLNDIKPYQASADEAVNYNLVRASDNSLLLEFLPMIIMVVLFIAVWFFIMKKMGGGGLGGRDELWQGENQEYK